MTTEMQPEFNTEHEGQRSTDGGTGSDAAMGQSRDAEIANKSRKISSSGANQLRAEEQRLSASSAKKDAAGKTAVHQSTRDRPKPPKPPTRQRASLPSVNSQNVPEELTGLSRYLAYLPGRRTTTSFSISTIVHVVLLVALMMIMVARQKEDGLLTIEAGIDADSSMELTLDSTERVPLQSIQAQANFQVSTDIDIPLPQALVIGAQASQARAEQSTLSTSADLKAFSNLPTGGGMSGRSEERRQDLVASEGGTEASERAVELGLAWLAAHQRENGAWWFNFHDSECRGRCRHPGSVGSSTAATGLALLCFLGRGETPLEGKYQDVVQRGLYYLQNRMVFTKYGGDLQEGTMYGHAIATLALCEAYGMTQDAALRPLAQKAIDYIVHAQHSKGGWRYTPKQPGDTTVTGWQVMALRSAHLAGLEVPTPTTELARLYLDSVQTHAGSRYKYLITDEDETPVPTAVGLLCRMYLGWSKDTTPLREGARYLAGLGPSTSDLYFDYYATQVLHHFGDPYWEGWNRLMRDYLVSNQATAGHEKGSWHFADEHGDQGGRLYSTAMAVMILEVYYRYLPLYESRAVEFPL